MRCWAARFHGLLGLGLLLADLVTGLLQLLAILLLGGLGLVQPLLGLVLHLAVVLLPLVHKLAHRVVQQEIQAPRQNTGGSIN